MLTCSRCGEDATVIATFDPPWSAAPAATTRLACSECLPALWRVAEAHGRNLLLTSI